VRWLRLIRLRRTTMPRVLRAVSASPLRQRPTCASRASRMPDSE